MELFMPEAGLVFWMFVVFVVLFAILAKFAWPVITKMVDERATLIDNGVEYAEAAKASLEDSESQARAILAEAGRQQMEILQEAAQMKAQIIEEAKKAAAAEAKKLVDAATISIEQSRKEAELQFRQEVSQFALTIAENIIRNQNGELDESQVELALELLDAYGCGYPNLVYDQSLTHISRFAYLSGVPTTYFVDKEGNVVGLGFLGALDEDSWQQIIAERLEMAQS